MPTDSLTTRVIDHIFDHIRSNGLTSGDTLPSEMRTSTDLKISRGIVREAFRSLEVAGIIEKGNGRSPKVGELNNSFLTHLMLHALTTSQISIKQVLEIRTLLEVHAAQMAAKRRTKSEITRLRAAVSGMKKSVTAPDQFVAHDLEFHAVIDGATGNPLVDMMCGAMHECMQQTMRVGIVNRRAKADVLKVVETHQKIADAVEEGNSQRAGVLMRKHFDDARRSIARSGVE
jgi:GntR family transcriptional repressor for pyruvate dehydrogenase complex